MKFVWVVVLTVAMTTTTQAQNQVKTATPTQGKTTAQSRSFGDLARAERNRKLKATPPTKTVDIQNVAVEKPEEKDATGAAAKAKPEKQPDPMEPRPISAQDIELSQLAQEKTDLLLQLSNVIRDRKAVDEIQQRLSEIQKRTDELKQPASKPSPRLK